MGVGGEKSLVTFTPRPWPTFSKAEIPKWNSKIVQALILPEQSIGRLDVAKFI